MLFIAYFLYCPCNVLSYASCTLGIGMVAVVCVCTMPSFFLSIHTPIDVKPDDWQPHLAATVCNDGRDSSYGISASTHRLHGRDKDYAGGGQLTHEDAT